MAVKRPAVAVPFIKNNYDAYLDALRAAGLEPVQTDSLSCAADCDALLLPGGADIDPSRYGEELNGSLGIDRELDALQFSALEKYCGAGKPVLGICRGHQIINVFFGGSLFQHLDTADAHSRKGGEEQLHGAYLTEGSFLAKLYPSRVTVNSSHHQGVKRAGSGLSIAAKAEDGTVEALLHEKLPVVSVQWHPERMLNAPDGKADGKLIFEYLRGLIEKSIG